MTTAIALGSVIEIELNGQEMTIKIRRYANDPQEANDPKVIPVSRDARLAKELLNAQEGEERTFTVNDRINYVRVLKIRS